MNGTGDGANAMEAWLARLLAPDGAPLETLADCGTATVPALAALAAEALARQRSLLVIGPDDADLTDLSNALDINLRPLCLVLPAAGHVSSIALRATLSLLRSRLSRGAEDTAGPAWATQRQRLAEQDGLWRQCLAWSQRGLDNESWPEGIESLFPVRILPLTLARQRAVSADWVVVTQAERLAEEELRAWSGALRTLLLGQVAPKGMPAAEKPAARQRAELDVLTQELSELELELATAQAEIVDFTRRYHALIGTRMATLDELRAELAARRAEADAADPDMQQAATTARARAERTRHESERFAASDREAMPSFRPSGDIKKLFRKLAQKIHPDRACDDADRLWRTEMMSEANRAYQAGDETTLLDLFARWQQNFRPDSGHEGDSDWIATQIARLKKRIAEIERELNRLFGSRLYELFTATNIARRAKRDLLQEMADRLDADIAAVRAQLA
ncbi:MAG: J domain-containing protein [Gammaproteobacteria bacterium]|nr:J domain-containing protein [Gammaproteobacteria bacterium]MBU1415227.1 J domain-containing protein [Gammaproteobacteria bacterium]